MSKYIDTDEVEKLLSCGCAYAIRELPTIETSEDAISREWLLEEYQKGKEKISESENFAELMWLVKHAPSVVQKPKEGEWIESPYEDADGMPAYRCSECGCLCEGGLNYCFMCGAKMKGEDDEVLRQL